jgi:uncharacterized membrane protein
MITREQEGAMEADGQGGGWLLRFSRSNHWLRRANAAFLVVWFGVALVTYSGVPSQVPMHFTLSGSPTRWEETTPLRWMGVPLVALALVIALPLMMRMQARVNAVFTMPGQEPRPAHEQAALFRAFLDITTTLMLVSMALLHFGIWLVATGRTDVLHPAIAVASLGGFSAITLLTISLSRASRRATVPAVSADGPIR